MPAIFRSSLKLLAVGESDYSGSIQDAYQSNKSNSDNTTFVYHRLWLFPGRHDTHSARAF